MTKIVFCYSSLDKENEGTEFLYGPLSLAYMATHTPDHYEMSLYDEYVGENLDPESIDADIVAISSLTSGIIRAYEIADKLKEMGITSVIGGAHATALPEEALQHFDVVIKGEGEQPWKEFLKDYEKGEIKKIYYGPMNVSLKELGVPNREFIHQNYHYQSVNTSRGCPFACSFCYLTVFEERAYRTIPHETILEDLEALRDESLIVVTDENFIGYSQKDYEDRKSLLRKIIDRDFNFVWGCQTTVKLAEDPEMMDLMYKAGCRSVFIGFESSNKEDLIKIGKKHNLETDYKKLIRKIHKHKITVIASCILGLDHQGKDYHRTLIKDLKHIGADYVRVFLMTAWPGTPLYKELKAQNRVIDNWKQVRKDIPSVIYKHYSHEEIIEARKEVMDSFFNFGNIIRVISRWVFTDLTLLSLFLKLTKRNRISEPIRKKRAHLYSESKES
ncbi:B12-binding domain-containing radical SAM protein [Bacteroidota bacterium]